MVVPGKRSSNNSRHHIKLDKFQQLWQTRHKEKTHGSRLVKSPTVECLLPWEDPAAAHEKKEMEDNEGPIAASREAALTGGEGPRGD